MLYCVATTLISIKFKSYDACVNAPSSAARRLFSIVLLYSFSGLIMLLHILPADMAELHFSKFGFVYEDLHEYDCAT